jgi:peptide/nickel transport system ATP-binding protein
MLMEARRQHFRKESREQSRNFVDDLLMKTGLGAEAFHKYPHQFSGGQRQRIGIARALVTEPEILVLDEAVSALDVSVQARILNLLNDLKSSLGLSYLFISHDLSVVKYMSDRMIIMKTGEIIEEGDPEKIYRKPRQAYTRQLLEAIPGFRDGLHKD